MTKKNLAIFAAAATVAGLMIASPAAAQPPTWLCGTCDWATPNAAVATAKPAATAPTAETNTGFAPVASIRGQYCLDGPNSKCLYAPDRHAGEVAVLSLFRKECFSKPTEDDPHIATRQGLNILIYRFENVWTEWNNMPMSVREQALKHEIAAINYMNHAIAAVNLYRGDWQWFCERVSESINKGHYSTGEDAMTKDETGSVR